MLKQNLARRSSLDDADVTNKKAEWKLFKKIFPVKSVEKHSKRGEKTWKDFWRRHLGVGLCGTGIHQAEDRRREAGVTQDDASRDFEC